MNKCAKGPLQGAYAAILPTRAGEHAALLTARGVARLAFPGQELTGLSPCRAEAIQDAPAVVRHARRLARELDAYHRGTLRRFSVPADLSGHTAFRRKVWRAMQRIPYGKTMTYGALAARVGCASARAVGQACGANPVPLLVPCHRVVSASGMGGWSGKPGMKEALLAHENAHAARGNAS